MKNKNLLSILPSLFLGLCLVALPVSAVDLAQAKSAGLVGEQLNGFLGMVKPDASAEIKALVDSINAQRLAEYQRIGTKNGVPAEEVGRLTAQKVIGQAAPGQFVETASGWTQR
ncbi:YdbL family protein [Methylomonas fluvii]|uniref:YdbL family protein n=1 Tax=Methylomonas fluvii TaxID=1854564 RepID=A0ABR9DG81_9GAMM|nr:YdbL family protein [Methylomonas fluvii]MBD9361866.1 YdbL family protein [Methylomonas fluvii]